MFEKLNKKNETMLKQGLKFNESVRVDVKTHNDNDDDDDFPEIRKVKPKLPHKLEYRVLDYKKSLTKITMDFNDTLEECQNSK